jgi:hypothetical protein
MTASYNNLTMPMLHRFNSTFNMQYLNGLAKIGIRNYNKSSVGCPIKGKDFQFFNYSGKMPHEKNYPRGDYKYEHRLYTDDDEELYKMTVYEHYESLNVIEW